jgi:hypothetical protein
MAGVVVLLCLGGAGVAVSLYDEATRVDRSEPDVVVSNYLSALLVTRDDGQVPLYACSEDGGALEPMRAYRRDIEERERQFNIMIKVSWGAWQVAPDGDDRVVTGDVTKAIIAEEYLVEKWQFRVVDQDGWRVCGARLLD